MAYRQIKVSVVVVQFCGAMARMILVPSIFSLISIYSLCVPRTLRILQFLSVLSSINPASGASVNIRCYGFRCGVF